MSQANDSHGDARAREARWSELMRAGLDGDAGAYRRLLEELAPMLRAMARRGLARAGLGNADVEDVVQEILLAIHLKRNTWMRDAPLAPWAGAIARHKLIDTLRRRGRRAETPIDDLIDVLPDTQAAPEKSHTELSRIVGRLDGRERDVVQAISLDGGNIKDTAAKLSISEGAVRVALHRGLKRLSQLYRDAEAAA